LLRAHSDAPSCEAAACRAECSRHEVLVIEYWPVGLHAYGQAVVASSGVPTLER
jgi:hypothetical protein